MTELTHQELIDLFRKQTKYARFTDFLDSLDLDEEEE